MKEIGVKNKLILSARFLSMALLQMALGVMVMATHAFADNNLVKNAKTMPLCDVVKSLVSEHQDGFKSLRGTRADTQYATIWKAKYNVVGDGCEIWQSGKGNTHYVCTRSAPSKQVADEYYAKARENVLACLGEPWSESEAPRKLADGTKATFSKSGLNTVIEIHEIKVSGLFKDQWTIYYFVGEPSERL